MDPKRTPEIRESAASAASAAAEVSWMGRGRFVACGLEGRTGSRSSRVMRKPTVAAAPAGVTWRGRGRPAACGLEHLQRLEHPQRRRYPAACGLGGGGPEYPQCPRPLGFWPPGPGSTVRQPLGFWPPGLCSVGPRPCSPGPRRFWPAARGLANGGPEHLRWLRPLGFRPPGPPPPGSWPPASGFRPACSFGQEAMETACGGTGQRARLWPAWERPPFVTVQGHWRGPQSWTSRLGPRWFGRPRALSDWASTAAFPMAADTAPSWNTAGRHYGRRSRQHWRMDTGDWAPINNSPHRGFRGFLVRG